MPLAGVIFDFDGVLANSEPLHLRVYREVLAPHGVNLAAADYYNRYLGFDDVGVFRAVAEDSGWELSEETLVELIRVKGERFDTLAEQGETLFPGAADCVRRLAAEVPIAIASGALRPEIEAMLATAGLSHYFKAIVASGDTPRSKPSPDPYVRAVELLRPCAAAASTTRTDDASDCFVAIEDSIWGIESALAAGLRCIGVAHTYPAEQLRGAHAVVPTISDIEVDAVRRLCEQDVTQLR
ncbi:MAG: HAD family phosphatase [Vicinamibacterales bacterium]|nr:HAD family phosphatase [Vicinamibacterales bacterium]